MNAPKLRKCSTPCNIADGARKVGTGKLTIGSDETRALVTLPRAVSVARGGMKG